jgi:hypothetical protein
MKALLKARVLYRKEEKANGQRASAHDGKMAMSTTEVQIKHLPKDERLFPVRVYHLGGLTKMEGEAQRV